MWGCPFLGADCASSVLPLIASFTNEFQKSKLQRMRWTLNSYSEGLELFADIGLKIEQAKEHGLEEQLGLEIHTLE